MISKENVIEVLKKIGYVEKPENIGRKWLEAGEYKISKSKSMFIIAVQLTSNTDLVINPSYSKENMLNVKVWVWNNIELIYNSEETMTIDELETKLHKM